MRTARRKHSNLPDDFYERIKNRLYRRICGELRTAKLILDIGCGGCELGRFIAEQNGAHVLGLDISDGKFPQQENLSHRVKCRKGDAGNIEFLEDRSVDGVVSVYSLHEMNNALKALEESRRVLRPAGRILIVDFPKGSLAQRLWNEEYYTRRQVESMLRKAGFAEARASVIYQEQLIWAQGRKARTEKRESTDRCARKHRK